MQARHLLFVVAWSCAIASCAGDDRGDDPRAAAQFDALVDNYFEAYLELHPLFATDIGDRRYNSRLPNDIAPSQLRAEREMEASYLQRIKTIDPATLDEPRQLSYQVFEYGRRQALERLRFPRQLLPVNQMYSMPGLFAQMGSGRGIHPFETAADYEDFLMRAAGFSVWVDQAIANMREGIDKGIVQPRVIVQKVLPQLAAQIVDDPEASVFYKPVAQFPATVPAPDRARLRNAFRVTIMATIVPAYRRLHEFMRGEYLDAARDTAGLGALPDGARWYEGLVADMTTTALGPAALHEIGLREVARVHAEMERVRESTGFKGDLKAFFAFLSNDPRFAFSDREQLLDGYRALRERVEAGLPKLFARVPRAGYEIRPVEAFREQSAAGASYEAPSQDGSRPGIFYVNTYALSGRRRWQMESLFLHEAVPGHHFQIALQQENTALPRFRRFGLYTAYVEGWALYAEGLGRDLGLYEDPYQYFGKLQGELWRSIRLVVDTGLHAKGWTREQVLDYMYANAPTREERAVAEAERYMALPGQALAYKVGQLKLQELRERARQALGSRFDPRAFHEAVLSVGALPLDILEWHIDRWIARSR